MAATDFVSLREYLSKMALDLWCQGKVTILISLYLSSLVMWLVFDWKEFVYLKVSLNLHELKTLAFYK